MGGLLVVIIIMVAIGIIWSFPLYLCGNFVLWLFHIPFHLTLLQSFGLCLLTSVICSMFFKKE